MKSNEIIALLCFEFSSLLQARIFNIKYSCFKASIFCNVDFMKSWRVSLLRRRVCTDGECVAEMVAYIFVRDIANYLVIQQLSNIK